MLTGFFFFFFNAEIEVCTLLNSCKKSLCKVQRIVIHVLGLSYKNLSREFTGTFMGLSFSTRFPSSPGNPIPACNPCGFLGRCHFCLANAPELYWLVHGLAPAHTLNWENRALELGSFSLFPLMDALSYKLWVSCYCWQDLGSLCTSAKQKYRDRVAEEKERVALFLCRAKGDHRRLAPQELCPSPWWVGRDSLVRQECMIRIQTLTVLQFFFLLQSF